MKKIILAILAVGVLGTAAYYVFGSEPQGASTTPAKTANKTTATAALTTATMPAKVSVPATLAPDPVVKEAEVPSELVKAVRVTLSPQATFDEKEAVWKQLKNNGQLDQAISELEEDAKVNPNFPETFVALGRAYMYKSGGIQDLSQMAAMVVKIDQSFAAALKLDPANWDAQYYKASSLSYYPAFMNKGPDVVAGYQNLIQQQETQPPQPQFANVYLNLGDQYQKQGDNDNAQKTWQRGAELFPDNKALEKRIIPPAAQP